MRRESRSDELGRHIMLTQLHNRHSFAVENYSSEPLEFTLDCSESKNVMSHRGSLVAVQIIPPKETKVMHHLMPSNAFSAWSWSYKASMSWIGDEE